MKTKTILYHRKASGKIKVWECWIDGIYVHTQWGQQDGEMNSTKEMAGARRGLMPVEIAKEMFDKKVERRRKRGYVERLDAVVADIRIDTKLDWTKPLPKSFAPAKPIKHIDPKEMTRLWGDNRIYVQRKRDGMRHFLVSDHKGKLRIYSSGKDDMTEHLQPLLKNVKLPARTIVDVELVVTEPGKTQKDGFLIVSGIARPLPERARNQIALAQGMGAKVQLFAFDILWLRGEAVFKYPYRSRYHLLGKTLAGQPDTLVAMPMLKCGLANAIDMVKKNKWEGLVLWHKDQATEVQINGSPKRVNCWKLKPIGEEDVIATGYELGKGKNHNVVGKFRIALLERPHGPSKTIGSMPVRQMGKCGTGLDDKTRAAALKWTYPCVIHIEFDQMSDKGFRFPVFIRKRDDKKVSECVL